MEASLRNKLLTFGSIAREDFKQMTYKSLIDARNSLTLAYGLFQTGSIGKSSVGAMTFSYMDRIDETFKRLFIGYEEALELNENARELNEKLSRKAEKRYLVMPIAQHSKE